MKRLLPLFAVAALSLTAACSMAPQATRNQSFADPAGSAADQMVAYAPDYKVRAISVGFAPNLRVSEANSYYPIADVVWRGDPYGDRFAQLHDLVSDSVTPVLEKMDGSVPVDVTITITRFHSLTEKTRYSVGGTHSIHLTLTLSDPATGAIIDGPRKVDASFPGLGGMAALAAEHRGETQKVRISARLAEVMRTEMARPVMVASAQ